MFPPRCRLIFGGLGAGPQGEGGGGTGAGGAAWAVPVFPPGLGGAGAPGGLTAGGATGGAGAGGFSSLSSGGRFTCACAMPGPTKAASPGSSTEARNTKQATQAAAKPLGAGNRLIVTMGGYTTRQEPSISSFLPGGREWRRKDLNVLGAGLSFRTLAFATAVSILGLGALTLPWLTVKESVGGEGGVLQEPASASSRGPGREQEGPGRRPGLLLLTPVLTPAGPRLASSAPALAAPAPDPASVRPLEERLGALGYMMGPKDGILDAGDRAGLTAFQKVENLPHTGEPDPATLSRLDTAQRPPAAYSTPPDHLAVDVARQVVFVVRGGQVAQILPTSTGNGKVFRSQGRRSRAVTPNGQFAITYKRNGWRRSPLGMLYRPAYFNGGIAFHGARSVPTSPASHGCVRLPMQFADWFADNASPVGMVVYVYGNPGEANPAPLTGAAAPPPFAPDGAPPPEAAPPASAPAPGSPPVLGGLLGG